MVLSLAWGKGPFKNLEGLRKLPAPNPSSYPPCPSCLEVRVPSFEEIDQRA